MSIPTRVEVDGKLYQGSYTTEGANLTVRYLTRAMSRPIGSEAPGAAAKGMLKQLVKLVHDLGHAA